MIYNQIMAEAGQKQSLLVPYIVQTDSSADDNFIRAIKDKLEEAGFKVETLSYLDKFDYSTDKMFRLLFNHSWCYINYLHVGNKILVPKLEY